MEIMYGQKVLEKLVAQWKRDGENIRACEKYIRENSVPIPVPFIPFFSLLRPPDLSYLFF